MSTSAQRNAINLRAMQDVRKWAEGTKSFLQAVHKSALEEVGWRLISYSPVGDPNLWHPPYWPKGYHPGQFRANWQVGRDVVPTGTTTDVDPMGYKTHEKMTKLGRWTIGHVYYFVNNLPYAYRLESGLHSTQVGPGGMVGRVRSEWSQIVKQAVADVKHTGRWKTGSSEE